MTPFPDIEGTLRIAPPPRVFPKVTPPAPLKKIISGVSEMSGVSVAELLGERRTRRVAAARRLVYWLARELTHHSFPTIGRLLNRDSSTVVHGARRAEDRRIEDPEYRRLTDDILKSLT